VLLPNNIAVCDEQMDLYYSWNFAICSVLGLNVRSLNFGLYGILCNVIGLIAPKIGY
jgi:hypothetical protein